MDNVDNLIPAWFDRARPLIGIGALIAPLYLAVLVGLGLAPRTIDVGYSPKQPVPFSHAVHAGELGMDCRYCHTTVEMAAGAAVPPTATCMNCHKQVAPKAATLWPIVESAETGKPVPWVRVHDLPDYVYFDHSAHVTRGVSCVSCHDRIDRMEQVYQAKTLSMAWCLDCHRNPDAHIRPKEFVTDLDWTPDEDPAVLGRRLREEHGIDPSTDCSTCHR